jgi:hypothetical protein
LCKEEANNKGKEKKKQLEEDQNNRAEHIKKNVHKDFSWNAHYHIRQANKCRKEALRHDELAKICKNKSRKKPE